MKSKLLAALGLLVAFIAAAADPITYVPELKPIAFSWEHDRRLSSPATYYKFYVGTNAVATVTTNDFTIIATTNGIPTLSAKVTFDHSLIGPNATNLWSLTSFDPIPNIESQHTTNILIGQVVGEPLPPSGIRKP